MNAFAFAWRSLTRQPARSTLGILGVAAVGALHMTGPQSLPSLLRARGYQVQAVALSASR